MEPPQMSRDSTPANRLSGDSESSIVTTSSSKDVLRLKEDHYTELPLESTSSEWTDEKHSLYLSFMEASFLNQLYNHEYDSCSLGPLSRGHDSVGWDTSRQDQSNSASCGQFKVLRNGCWKQHNVGRSHTLPCDKNGSYALLRNPWIQHFMQRSHGKGSETVLSTSQKADLIFAEEGHSGRKRQRIISSGEATNSNASCKITCQKTFDNNAGYGDFAEVSDQNFVDDSCIHEVRLNTSALNKRMRNAVPSTKDQVIPAGALVNVERKMDITIDVGFHCTGDRLKSERKKI